MRPLEWALIQGDWSPQKKFGQHTGSLCVPSVPMWRSSKMATERWGKKPQTDANLQETGSFSFLWDQEWVRMSTSIQRSTGIFAKVTRQEKEVDNYLKRKE